MKFSIPYNGDPGLLDKLESNNLTDFVHGIYFCGNPNIIKSARRPKIQYFIDKQENGTYSFNDARFDEDIIRVLSFCARYSIESNLLLNISASLTGPQINYLKKLHGNGLDAVTIGNYELLVQVNKINIKSLVFHNSVYFTAKTSNDIKESLDLGIKYFLIPTELNKNIMDIERYIAEWKNQNISFKLLLNEGCLPNCSHRCDDQKDAESYPLTNAIYDFTQTGEPVRILKQPCRHTLNSQNIHITNFIHPQLLRQYLGYDFIFKISGRSFNSDTIINIIHSYINMEYKGDLRFLVENFKHSIIPIENEPGKILFKTN